MAHLTFSYSGQGTISLELLEDFPEIDTIIVPISGKLLKFGSLFTFLLLAGRRVWILTCKQNFAGGGLISGVALAAKSVNPSIRVLAAEPIGANDAALSKASGKIVTLPQTNTIADGLRASLADQTWYMSHLFPANISSTSIFDKPSIFDKRRMFTLQFLPLD